MAAVAVREQMRVVDDRRRRPRVPAWSATSVIGACVAIRCLACLRDQPAPDRDVAAAIDD
jgi:hypothetical protein